MLYGEPEPLQPQDAPNDRILTMEVSTRFHPMDFLERVEFECAQCHMHYWRSIIAQEKFSEVVIVEGIGTYSLDPELVYNYGDKLHVCVKEE